jgi:hypothetical protein
MIDSEAVPEAVRREAFTAAMLAVRRVTREHGYPLDVLAELEIVDAELAATAGRLGVDADEAHVDEVIR